MSQTRGWNVCSTQLALYEHPLLDFSAHAKGEGVEVLINFRNPPVPVHTYQLRVPSRETSIIRNSSGVSSASSSTACTTTWSKCSSARRKTGRTASGRVCEPRQISSRKFAITGRSRFRVTWSCASTIPNLATTRGMPSSSVKPATFIPRAMCTLSSDACWRASSKKFGECWDRRRGLKFWNLVRARTVRAGCARLVGEKVSGILSGSALFAIRTLAGAAGKAKNYAGAVSGEWTSLRAAGEPAREPARPSEIRQGDGFRRIDGCAGGKGFGSGGSRHHLRQ